MTRDFYCAVADALAGRDLVLWAKAHAIAGGLDVKVEEPEVASVSIQGPKSVDLLCDLYGNEFEDLGFFKFRSVRAPCALHLCTPTQAVRP